MLFFIVTRAKVCHYSLTRPSILLTRLKGAEPIYLHVIRPLVKPYTDTLDSLLEFGHHLGDLIFVFANIPVHFVKSFFDRWTGRGKATEAIPETKSFVADTPEGEEPPVIPAYPSDLPADPAQAYGTTRTRQRPLQGAHQRAASGTKPQIYAAPASQKIWVPPASAYNDSPPAATKELPVDDEIQRAHIREVEEWRQYEPFPSAYPVSPVQASTQLPSLAAFGGIYAAPVEPPPAYTRAPSSGNEQHFQQSLKPLRESLNPDSDGDLSDDQQSHSGVHTDDDNMSVDEDYTDEEDDDDDDFNVTLRTPMKITRMKNVSNMTTTSIDNSTGLSTVDHDSGFRTHTESESATSDAGSLAGHKRVLSTQTEEEAPARPPLRAKISDNGTIRAKPTVRVRARPPPIFRVDSRASESSASGVENCRVVTNDAAKKRRGTASPQRKEPIRRPLGRPVGANVRAKTGDATGRPIARKTTAIPRAVSGSAAVKPVITKPGTRPTVTKTKTGSSAESVKMGE